MLRFFTLLFLLVFSATRVSAQEDGLTHVHDSESEFRDHPVDMKKLRLQIAFEPAAGKVLGTVTHFFTVLDTLVDSVFLDGPGIQVINAATSAGKLAWRSTESGLWFRFPKSLRAGSADSMRIVYEATPEKGLYFIGWNDPSNRARKQIWSQGQGIDNRHWIPMYDERNDKVITELLVSMPAPYKVLSNGHLVSKPVVSNGITRWHYLMDHPHAPYLIMLGIGEYEIQTRMHKKLPLNFYYYPGEEKFVEPTYRHSIEMMRYFESEIGLPFPWESYSQIPVMDFMYGAMENTTATLFGDFFLGDPRTQKDRAYLGVNAHELAHQWFGDYVTARSEPHHWLQESFATHYNQLYEGVAYGKNYYDWSRRSAVNRALEAAKKDQYPVVHSKAGSPRVYQKGATILHMLKYVLGRSVYNKGILEYLKRHPYGIVETSDLQQAMEDVSGKGLSWFFNQWLYQPGEPSYRVEFFEQADGNQKQAVFQVQQVHALNDFTGLFTMPVHFQVWYTDGTCDSAVFTVSKKSEAFRFNTGNKTIDYALFDVNSEIMKSFEFIRKEDMILAQAMRARHMLDRYDAWVDLRPVAWQKKEKAAQAVLSGNDYHPIKNEVLRQVKDAPDALRLQAYKNAFADKELDVRRSAVEFAGYAPELTMACEKLLNDSSWQLIESAMSKLISLSQPDADRYFNQCKGIRGNRAHNVAIRWHELNAFYRKDRSSVDSLIDFASVSFDFQTRSGAFAALIRLGVINDQSIASAVGAAASANSRLAGPAREYLVYFSKQTLYRNMLESYYEKCKVSTEKKALSKILYERN